MDGEKIGSRNLSSLIRRSTGESGTSYKVETNSYARISELNKQVGHGPFAKESIPARNSKRSFTKEEREKINEIGKSSGCHTCGSSTSGTRSGNFVLDHQPPTAVNKNNGAQQLYPQCINCSSKQGGLVRELNALISKLKSFIAERTKPK